MLDREGSIIDCRRPSSWGNWRGDSGGPDSTGIFAKYGCRGGMGGSWGFSRARTVSMCFSTSLCMLETTKRQSVTMGSTLRYSSFHTISEERALPVGHNDRQKSRNRMRPLNTGKSAKTRHTPSSEGQRAYIVALCETFGHALASRIQRRVAFLGTR